MEHYRIVWQLKKYPNHTIQEKLADNDSSSATIGTTDDWLTFPIFIPIYPAVITNRFNWKLIVIQNIIYIFASFSVWEKMMRKWKTDAIASKKYPTNKTMEK